MDSRTRRASGLLGISTDLSALLPLDAPHELVLQAVVEGSLAVDQLLPAFGHVGGSALLCVALYGRGLSSRGGTA